MSRTTPLYVIWQFRQVVDYLLSLDHVTFGAALQQSLRKAGCAPNTLHDLAAPEQLIDSLTHLRNSFVEVADAEALTCRTNLHHWQVDPEVPLLQSQIADLRQHLDTALAFGGYVSLRKPVFHVADRGAYRPGPPASHSHDRTGRSRRAQCHTFGTPSRPSSDPPTPETPEFIQDRALSTPDCC